MPSSSSRPLNTRGLRLSAGDLLKSHILGEIASLHPEDLKRLDDSSNKWDGMVTRLATDDPTKFLRHDLLVTHERVRKEDIFPYFKEEIAERKDPEGWLEDLADRADKYADFERPPRDDPELFDLFSDLKGTSVDTHRVALLAARLWVEPKDTKAFVKFGRVAEVLSFRWAVTGGN